MYVYVMNVLDRLQVMQAYQAGVAALRLSLKDVTVERAESLVDQIQEVDGYLIFWTLLLSTVNFPHGGINTLFFLLYVNHRLKVFISPSFSSCVTLKMKWTRHFQMV